MLPHDTGEDGLGHKHTAPAPLRRSKILNQSVMAALRLARPRIHGAAEPQPNRAKRLECVRPAALLMLGVHAKGGSKLHALSREAVPRAIRSMQHALQPANDFDFCSAVKDTHVRPYQGSSKSIRG